MTRNVYLNEYLYKECFFTCRIHTPSAGVAFEQGRTLPTPEKVPFRLTRDIIDGMGVCGIEGVFRRCCEEILNTMKASQEEVKTIVEVSTCAWKWISC